MSRPHNHSMLWKTSNGPLMQKKTREKRHELWLISKLLAWFQRNVCKTVVQFLQNTLNFSKIPTAVPHVDWQVHWLVVACKLSILARADLKATPTAGFNEYLWLRTDWTVVLQGKIVRHFFEWLTLSRPEQWNIKVPEFDWGIYMVEWVRTDLVDWKHPPQTSYRSRSSQEISSKNKNQPVQRLFVLITFVSFCEGGKPVWLPPLHHHHSVQRGLWLVVSALPCHQGEISPSRLCSQIWVLGSFFCCCVICKWRLLTINAKAVYC